MQTLNKCNVEGYWACVASFSLRRKNPYAPSCFARLQQSLEAIWPRTQICSEFRYRVVGPATSGRRFYGKVRSWSRSPSRRRDETTGIERIASLPSCT